MQNMNKKIVTSKMLPKKSIERGNKVMVNILLNKQHCHVNSHNNIGSKNEEARLDAHNNEHNIWKEQY